MAVTHQLETAFEQRLVDEVGAPTEIAAKAVVPALLELVHGDGPSLSSFLKERGTREHIRELCVHRSEYQRKEADPHTWMIPRLRGRAKAAAVTIQYDEYGEGSAPAMHAELFARTMEALGLDPGYGAYRDLLPAATLATGNLVSMFGLHRRWRAACVGHLAVFEMTSVTPMTRYSSALRRMGVREDARRFYDVHVEADAWHEQVAQHELVAGLLEAEPKAGGAILFGARALMEVERRMTVSMLDAWAARRHLTPRAIAAAARRILSQPTSTRGSSAMDERQNDADQNDPSAGGRDTATGTDPDAKYEQPGFEDKSLGQAVNQDMELVDELIDEEDGNLDRAKNDSTVSRPAARC